MKARQLVLLFALLQLCVAFLTNAQTFTHEESMWHYIGRNWLRYGFTPYSGGIDNKSPLLFAVFGLSDVLFGINYWFPRLIGIAVQSVGVLFIYRIAKQLYGPQGAFAAAGNGEGNKAAIIATTIYGLSLMWRATGGKYVSFTETYAATLIIISVYRFISTKQSRNYFFSGLLAGCALAWRLSAGFSITAILAYSLIKKRNAVFPFLAGVIVMLIVLLLLATAASISVSELWLYAFAGNFGSGSTTDHSLAWKMDSFLEGFLYSEMALFYPIVAAYFLLRKKYSLLTIWLICEFIGINVLGIYARPHFKSLLPVLSLLGGISIARLIARYNISMRTTLVITWIIFFPKITEPLMVVKRIVFGRKTRHKIDYCAKPELRPDEQSEKQLGLWIKNNTLTHDKVFVAGFGARVQLYSERLSPTAYFNVTQTPEAKTMMMNEMLLNKPATVVIPVFDQYKQHVDVDIRAFIDSLAGKDYTLQQCLNGYSIYRKKGER